MAGITFERFGTLPEKNNVASLKILKYNIRNIEYAWEKGTCLENTRQLLCNLPLIFREFISPQFHISTASQNVQWFPICKSKLQHVECGVPLGWNVTRHHAAWKGCLFAALLALACWSKIDIHSGKTIVVEFLIMKASFQSWGKEKVNVCWYRNKVKLDWNYFYEHKPHRLQAFVELSNFRFCHHVAGISDSILIIITVIVFGQIPIHIYLLSLNVTCQNG